MASRYNYSKHELDRYFDRVCMPKSRRIYDVSGLSNEEKLSFLNLLQKHQLVKVPWENLSQHYSWHKTVSVKPRVLFNKIVNGHARGGYCMEVNYFYHLILVTLGFNVYLAGSRIYNQEKQKYGGWTHIVNLVTIGDKKHLVDSGFGSQGPSAPLPLEPGAAVSQVSPAEMRVLYEAIPNHLDRSQRVWIYQHRPDDASDWTPMYSFTDLEFTPEDVEAMNFEPWLDCHTFFTHKVVANRFTTDREIAGSGDKPGTPGERAMEGEIDGALTVNQDVLKWRRHGEKVIVERFGSEGERVAALRKYFGIELAEEDVEGVLGTAAKIGVKALGVDD